MSAARSLPLDPRIQALALPSGRRVEVQHSPDEGLRLLSPDGLVELEIALTPAGPVLRGRALRLELSAETLDLRAAEISMQADNIHMAADREVVVTGALIRLN